MSVIISISMNWTICKKPHLFILFPDYNFHSKRRNVRTRWKRTGIWPMAAQAVVTWYTDKIWGPRTGVIFLGTSAKGLKTNENFPRPIKQVKGFTLFYITAQFRLQYQGCRTMIIYWGEARTSKQTFRKIEVKRKEWVWEAAPRNWRIWSSRRPWYWQQLFIVSLQERLAAGLLGAPRDEIVKFQARPFWTRCRVSTETMSRIFKGATTVPPLSYHSTPALLQLQTQPAADASEITLAVDGGPAWDMWNRNFESWSRFVSVLDAVSLRIQERQKELGQILDRCCSASVRRNIQYKPTHRLHCRTSSLSAWAVIFKLLTQRRITRGFV